MSKQGFTVTQAAAALGKSSKTIYRWLADGKLNAQKIKGEWRIFELPDQVTKEKPTRQTGQRNVQSVQNEPTLDYATLLIEIERANQEAGYWKGRYQEVARLLEAPKKQPRLRRLISIIKRKLALSPEAPERA